MGRARTSLTAATAMAVAAMVWRVRVGRDPRLFARCYARRARRAATGELGQRRRRLLTHAEGRVLDLGAGTGESFPHLPPAVSQLVAVEPDPWMIRQAKDRVADAPAPVRTVRAVSGALPFVDRSFDTAVAALVLCTVDDLEGALAELHRVIRPGGRLLLTEHVRAADPDLAQLQDLLERPWAWCNGGCRPNRRTLDALGDAGFRVVEADWYGYPVLPHVDAIAVRT